MLHPDNGDVVDVALASRRQQVCFDKFGQYGADQNPQRDFPILSAFEDHLIVGRYAYLDPINRPANGRVIVPQDTTAQDDFKMAQCCFHNQAHFHVRAGSEWVALAGAGSTYLHHVVAGAGGMCVQSCDPRTVLMSSRVPELAIDTFGTDKNGAAAVEPPACISANCPLKKALNRNSPFALRNPFMSFYMPAPIVTGSDTTSHYSVTQRDDTWQFQTRGQYVAEAVGLAGTIAVLPQSSAFVGPLGAIAVVDGSAQGLFIIDLNTLAIADGSPFF